MKKWLFLWSSKRQPIWETTLHNLNLAVGTKDNLEYKNIQSVPMVNEFRTNLVESQDIETLNELQGQILSQFENESFKFVIEKNCTNLSPSTNQLVLKPYMFLDMGLNETNCKPINLNEVEKHLEDNEWCALGFFINGNPEIEYSERANTLSKATWYTRKDNYRIFDLNRQKYLPDKFSLNAITYLVFRKLTDENVILCYTNHNLVSLPAFDTDVSRDGLHTWSAANIMDSGMFDCLIKPNIINAEVHNNIIIAKNNFELELFAGSEINFIFDYVPKLNVEISTNLKYTVKDNKYIIEKGTGYLIFKINTGDFTNKYDDFSEAGIYTLTYNVYGD